MTRKIEAVGRRRTPGQALREFWGWLSGNGYRPERHYMRGGRHTRAASRSGIHAGSHK